MIESSVGNAYRKAPPERKFGKFMQKRVVWQGLTLASGGMASIPRVRDVLKKI
jgi:hypothetical protein